MDNSDRFQKWFSVNIEGVAVTSTKIPRLEEHAIDSAESMYANHDNLTGWVNNPAETITNAMALSRRHGTSFSGRVSRHRLQHRGSNTRALDMDCRPVCGGLGWDYPARKYRVANESSGCAGMEI